MTVNWGDIYEAIYLNTSDTTMADAFRRAVGLPTRPPTRPMVAYERESCYAGVDFDVLMSERRGVRM